MREELLDVDETVDIVGDNRDAALLGKAVEKRERRAAGTHEDRLAVPHKLRCLAANCLLGMGILVHALRNRRNHELRHGHGPAVSSFELPLALHSIKVRPGSHRGDAAVVADLRDRDGPVFLNHVEDVLLPLRSKHP